MKLTDHLYALLSNRHPLDKKQQKKFLEEFDYVNGISVREYRDYKSYLKHQSSWFPKVKKQIDIRKGNSYIHFINRFKDTPELHEPKNVLCLGACEAEVFSLNDLGHNAVGLNLNSMENVIQGDFHYTDFENNLFDVIYTNCLQHVYELNTFSKEVSRLLKPKGYFMTDVCLGRREGFLPGEFDVLSWEYSDDILHKIEQLSVMTLLYSRDNSESTFPEKGATFQK